MKIAIVTFFDNGNYGSELQSLAMNYYLRELGHEPCFCKIKSTNKIARILELVYDKISVALKSRLNSEYKSYLADRALNAKNQRSISPELKIHIHKCIENRINICTISRFAYPDLRKFVCYICGSDQVWSALKMPFPKENFLSGVPSERKIAYAPSMGLDKLPNYYIKSAGKYIRDFKYLSVREKAAQEAIKENWGLDAKRVLDPTLLVGKDYWNTELEKANKIAPTYSYVFCYFLGSVSNETLVAINNISEGRKVIMLPYEEDAQNIINGEYVLADPLDFVNLIKNADYVLTDSFHGSVFSILYNKQFVVTKRTHVGKVSQTSRITSLLEMCGLMNQYCSGTDTIVNRLSNIIDYAPIQRTLVTEQGISFKFLSSALIEIEKQNNEQIFK